MKAIIMAGGKGTRLYDSEHPSPKVLREALGRPLISYVLDSIDFIPEKDIHIIVGFMADAVKAAFPKRNFVLQGDKGYGTGYAVQCAVEQEKLEEFDGNVVILSGDVPLINKETIVRLAKQHEEEGNACTLLSCVSERELPFGRILRDADGNVKEIKEHKDCSEEERKVRELNVGLYVFDCKKLCAALKRIDCNNAANEYYLTDVPKIMLSDGEKVGACITHDERELCGVNTPDDLAYVEKLLSEKR